MVPHNGHERQEYAFVILSQGSQMSAVGLPNLAQFRTSAPPTTWARVMMEGEFNSMTTIYAYIPTFAPKPLA
jgi:hypothetical protein